jgi:hypothetical protein
MGVPGTSCSPGVGICMMHGFLLYAFPTSLPFPQQNKTLDGILPFICILYLYFLLLKKPFTRVGTVYIKWKGGAIFFFLKGGMSLSKEKKACCTRLAGSDISQRRFACCHSQRKMPPLPRSQSATLLFCVPEMYPS